MPDEIVIVPQVRQRPVERSVRLTAVEASIDIQDQVATTTLALSLHNPSGGPLEAHLLLPVPEGASVRSLQYDGTGPEPTARLLPRDEARRIYEAIVNKARDPALLEFVGYSMIRTSVFPVPAGATQVVRIAYEQLLPSDLGRLEYVLPRSESLEATDVAWTIRASVRNQRPIAAIYSPSHDIATQKIDARQSRVTLGSAHPQPGAFRLTVVPQAQAGQDIAATFVLYPDAELSGGAGGYFLMLAGAPGSVARAEAIKRDVVIVLDRSGSMAGEKFAQARAAALQVLEGLAEGESFNIVDYSDSIATLSGTPVVKSAESMARARAYLAQLQAVGGTNLNDALQEALRLEPAPGTLPLALFLTDGLPTVGERAETAIRDNAKRANTHARRVFTFGVGLDVNAPLLNSVARAARAVPTFILPGEDVEVKVSQVYRRLSGPVLEAPRLEAAARPGGPVLRELQPAELMDLFEGDQLVVLGQYTAAGKHAVRLHGNYLGRPRTFEFELDTAAASARHGYVPRLWATRAIGALLESVRELGSGGTVSPDDPRMKELVGEIVRLSTKHGILTEYTAFLATEPGAAPEPVVPVAAAARETRGRLEARAARTGAAGVNQEMNLSAQVAADCVNTGNEYWTADLQRARVTGCQMANDQVVFHRGTRWVDARLLESEGAPPEETVEFGTDAFSRVVDQLAREGRQALLARGGEVYLLVEGKRVLVRMPA
ncbi:MAG TPA: VIT domain-containing protein [Phycisphaerales bacterium]|nr:VIT domain-containing protein [Phycisphaerales bacterium]